MRSLVLLLTFGVAACQVSQAAPPETKSPGATAPSATPAAAHGEHASSLPVPAFVNESSPVVGILAEIFHDNADYAARHDARFFAPFQAGQQPRATVVGCSDSRFHIGTIDKSPDGKIFTIRNIGNQVDSAEGSVEYAIHHLHTPLLFIIGHVGCGAVKAAMGDYSEEAPPIRRELDGLHLSIRRTGATGTFDQQWLTNVHGNVHQQVTDALREYRQQVTEGSLHVLGGVYDFRNDLGQGYGKLVVVNVDGETDRSRIEKSPLVQFARKMSIAQP